MNINKAGIVCTYFFLSTISIVFLWTAGYSMSVFGKSKTRIKKINKNIAIYKKLLLLYPAEASSEKLQKQRTAQRIYWLYLLVFFLGLIIMIISFCWSQVDKLFIYVTYAKLFLVDVSVWLYSFIMTKHGRNGGVVWRWEE